MKNRPSFQNKALHICYEIAERFYYLVLIAYVPALLVGTLIARLSSPGGFMDFGYSFSLLVMFLGTVPFFLGFVLFGMLISFLLRRATREREKASFDTPQFERKLSKIKNVITAVIVTTSVLGILFVPYSEIHYGDGGTVKRDALLYTVVEWNRTEDWSGNPLPEEPQSTQIYFFPNNLLSYEELWDLKH